MLEELRAKNTHIEILELSDEKFNLYGKVLPYIKTPKMNEFVYNTPMADDYYCVCSEELMQMDEAKQFQQYVFGEIPCQVGYYNAYVDRLNALEYHKGSEVLVVLEDVVMLIANIADIQEDVLNSNDVKAFYVPRNTCVELYATTLHYAPCMATSAGVRQIVVQTKGTNTPLDEVVASTEGENKMLLEKNKWVIAHKDASIVNQGAFIGIIGDNIQIKPID